MLCTSKIRGPVEVDITWSSAGFRQHGDGISRDDQCVRQSQDAGIRIFSLTLPGVEQVGSNTPGSQLVSEEVRRIAGTPARRDQNRSACRRLPGRYLSSEFGCLWRAEWHGLRAAAHQHAQDRWFHRWFLDVPRGRPNLPGLLQVRIRYPVGNSSHSQNVGSCYLIMCWHGDQIQGGSGTAPRIHKVADKTLSPGSLFDITRHGRPAPPRRNDNVRPGRHNPSPGRQRQASERSSKQKIRQPPQRSVLKALHLVRHYQRVGDAQGLIACAGTFILQNPDKRGVWRLRFFHAHSFNLTRAGLCVRNPTPDFDMALPIHL